MIQSFFKRRRRPWESDSSTDCSLNSSLLGIQTMDSASSRQGRHDDAGARSQRQVKFPFSSIGKQRPTACQESKPSCCGHTATETVDSWSQAGASRVERKQTLSEVLSKCFICFWPTMSNVEERHHNDCFLAVDCNAEPAEEQHDWHASYADTPVFRTDASDDKKFRCIEQIDEDVQEEEPSMLSPLTKEILSIPKPPVSKLRQINVEEANACQVKLARMTPVTVHSKASLTECTKNGGTMASTMNTLHRRTDDISLGFFTAQTLDAIHTSPTKMNEPVTPRNTEKRANIGGKTRSAFKTPGGNRARVDSETFRRTIKVVTCEKRKISISDDSDVSPIDSEAGFSPMGGARNHRIAPDSLPPRQSPATVQKKLAFDIWSVRRYETPHVASRALPSNTPSRNLLQEFTFESVGDHLSPLSEFGMSVMKSLQSIVQGRPPIPPFVQTSGYEADKENTGYTPQGGHVVTISALSAEREQLWQDTFLQKSSSFLKALRRKGRRGKVLIQGWVAFHETVHWKEILRNPKRRDFRYIVLLDDMPLLHMFRSRPKQKRMMPKHDVLQDCTCLELTDRIAVKVRLASKDLGNEVCLFDQETERYLYGLLPIPMPEATFLDKHQSRLAKGDALRQVFEPFKRSVKFAPHSKAEHGELPTTMEQYDVSRHLLFVVDCAIKFPIDKPGRPLAVWM